jgi:molybdenum cofactor cytidylyltransferase
VQTAPTEEAETFPLRLGVVILAAGASSRMGRPKLLLPWGDTSMIGHLLAQWHLTGAAQVGVVCAKSNDGLDRELDRLGLHSENRIVNPAPEGGMYSSIRCAASWKRWSPTITHWAISLGDQPHVRTETLRHLLGFAAHHPQKICQPSRHGRGRHPVILPAALFKELACTREENLNEFLKNRADKLVRCEIDDAGLDLDLDTPTDYDRALAMASPEN